MDEGASDAAAAARRFLTFRIENRLYALPAEQVSEVIRMPAVARVPMAPKSLLGLANLRGSILPLASVRGLLGRPEGAASPRARAIVLGGGAPVALAVDAIGGLVEIDVAHVESRQVELSRDDGEELTGVFRSESGEAAKVLDVRRLLDAAFVQRERPERRAAGVASLARSDVEAQVDHRERLITFDVAGQEFALALGVVREVVSAPANLTAAPRSEALVLGVMAYRDMLLPLLSLRGLLGFQLDGGRDGREKVVVTEVGGVLVGLVADRMRAIIAADPALVEPTPPMLAARTGGESRVSAIYRGDGGRRLVSILAPDRLFREDVMQRLGETRPSATPTDGIDRDEDELQILVFQLGDEEFGLPIEAVDEVARVPDRITRIPKTPKFLEGVVNLRGEILPVIDQRRRFDMPPAGNPETRRLIVMRAARHRAGLIVDGVTEVLRCSPDSVGEAPHLSGETMRLVRGVVNLEASGRLVLLLDPAELLTRAEHSLLDAFATRAEQAAV